jgi:hypothetical protein
MWKCPNCSREFFKTNQMHSCKKYPAKNHFEKKEEAEKLYEELLKILKKEVGEYKIESLPCCIHIVDKKTNYTYLCVYAFKEGLRLHLAFEKAPKSIRIEQSIRIGKNKYKYSIIVKSKKDLDKELIMWIKQANSKIN